MRLLRAHRGMHAGIHREGSRAVQWEMDLRPLLRGGEGRDGAFRDADQHRRSHEPTHELLQEFQVLEPTVEPHRPPHLRHASASPAKLGLSQGLEVDAEQPRQTEKRDSVSGAESIGKLLSDLVRLINSRVIYLEEEKKKEAKGKKRAAKNKTVVNIRKASSQM